MNGQTIASLRSNLSPIPVSPATMNGVPAQQSSSTIAPAAPNVLLARLTTVCAPHLHGWARYRTIGTVHTAVTGLWFQPNMTSSAFVKEDARVGRHCKALGVGAGRASQDGEKIHFENVLDPLSERIREIFYWPQLHFAGRIGMQECL